MEGKLKTYEEKVRFLTEVLKLCWITIVGLTGGLVGLTIKHEKDILIMVFIISGVLAELVLAAIVVKLLLKINALLKEMSKLNTQEEKDEFL